MAETIAIPLIKAATAYLQRGELFKYFKVITIVVL